MVTRPELIELAKELSVDFKDLSLKELKEYVNEKADKLFGNRKIPHSADNISERLLKYLTEEYDYILKYKGD